jgi:hypothetical protein
MKPLRCLPCSLVTIILAIFMGCPHAMGFDFEKGIHGIRWESSASQYDFLTKVRENQPFAYYVNEAMLFTLANQPVPGVIYGFHEGRFFAVYIKLRSPDQFHHMKKRFSAEYGPARVKSQDAGDQTIYRWQDRAVKIKLKNKASSGEMKLGIYYDPISSRLNRDPMEKIPPEDFPDQSPEGGSTNRSAPLL